MSNNQLDSLKESHRPIHAFYAPPPTGFILSDDNDNRDAKPVIATTLSIKPTSTSAPKPNSSVVSINSSRSVTTVSIISTVPSVAPVNMKPPPFINNVNDPSFNSKTPMNRENKDELPWLAPLLGVLGTLGVVAIGIIYLIGRNRKKKSNATFSDETNDRSMARHFPKQHLQAMPNTYQSWASLSTINTSAENNQEKKKIIIHQQEHVPPPPAYTSIRQKRMTADTLVDENNTSMLLKNQYAPQLAFSPSLVAGEFQQQQQLEERPPLPTISPSNTLIDNAGVLSGTTQPKLQDYNYSFDQRSKKIEMYEPQVNLHDGENPFIPYSYSNDEDKENTETEKKEDHRDIVNVKINYNSDSV
ncbi:hypothetical protein MFLAVUS_008743 [Mucor flavus]|uniref:Uncharacterized protein n=1 Tax=Mucor flavus TaxID=439312 RepID=A0ABP9Z808_9FUNG